MEYNKHFQTKVKFYYEVDKEVGIAEDENGANAPAYMVAEINLNIKSEDELTEEYRRGVSTLLKESVSDQLGIATKYIKDITKEEYEEGSE